MLDANAYKQLYTKIRGRPDEPRWSKVVGAIKLPGKVRGVAVILHLGRKQLKLPDACLTKQELVRQQGGTTHWNFTIQCVPDLDESHPILETLFSKFGERIDVTLECESYGAQPDLPLEEEEKDDEEGEEGKAPEGDNVVDIGKGRGKKGKKDTDE